MDKLLPLLVVIPLGAAFLIPLLSLFTARKKAECGEVVALIATLALLVLSVIAFAGSPTLVTWIGGYTGRADLLGIRGRTLSADESPTEEPALLVEQVVGGSRAERADLRAGDVVTAVRTRPANRLKPVHSANQLRRLNASLEPQSPISLQVVRDGAKLPPKQVVGGKGTVGIPMFSDGMTRLMLLIIGLVSFTAVLFSISYMQKYTKLHLYYSPLMLMIAGMNGVVLSGDLFNIYVFLEVAAVASYALVGFGVHSEELEASFKYLVLSAVASAFILLGVGIVYSLRGTLNLAQIAAFTQAGLENDAMWLALGFFLAGFGLKAAMVPFHAWLPDAHPSAPAPVSAMLSGVLIKACGVYVLARIVFNVFGVSGAVAWVLITMGALSMVVGVFLAVGQWDFKRLLAYHSISQMGYVVLALGVGAEALAGQEAVAGNWELLGAVAVFAGLFHLLNHSMFKSLLFLSSGSVVYVTGTRDLKSLGGLGERMPLTSLCARVGSLSISGVPPFNGFFSKLLIVIAVCWAGHWFLGALTVLVSFMTLLSFTKVQRYLIEGDPPPALAEAEEAPITMVAAMGILALMCLALGVLLPLHAGVLLKPATQSLGGQLAGYIASVFGG